MKPSDSRRRERSTRADRRASDVRARTKLSTYSRKLLFADPDRGSRSAVILSRDPVGPIVCDCWKVAYITAGCAALVVNDEVTQQVRVGDIVVLRRGVIYSVIP